MSNHRGFILVTILLVTGCSIQPFDWGEPNPESNNISIYELVANGEKYNGWRVRVSGAGIIQFESHLLFVSKERFEEYDTSSSLLLDIEPESMGTDYLNLKKYDGKFYLIEGLFTFVEREKLKKNEFSVGPAYAGVLSNINRIAIYD